MTPNAANTSIPEWMRKQLDDGQRFMLMCTVCGVLCGLVGVGFHIAIQGLFEALWRLAAAQSQTGFIAIMLGAPTFAGLLVGVASQTFAPRVAGSGIPQTKASYFNKSGIIPFADGVWRFLLGTLYVGLGNSLGREGPTVHISASVSSTLGRWAFRDLRRSQSMVPVGVAGGVAAAFNAPIAAIMFVFEELMDNFSTKALGGIAIAVVIASTVSRMILGEDPIVNSHLAVDYKTSLWMLIAIPLGVSAGLFGPFFTGMVLKFRRRLKEQHILPVWIRPASGGFILGCLGLGAWFISADMGHQTRDVFSIGYESLELAFEAKLSIGILALLFLVKGLAVMINYATGGSGGLFSPTLFLGGMIGGMMGIGLSSLNHFISIPGYPGDSEVIGGCVLLGMGALFGSIIRNPLTSLIMIFEMTGTYSLILPLMGGNLISWAIATKLQPTSLYNALLLQDGITLRMMPSYRGSQDYTKLPVATIMTHDVHTVRSNSSIATLREDLRTQKLTHHGYPVLNADGCLTGIITRSEIRLSSPESTVEELIADQKLLSLPTDCSIRDAANQMINRDIQQVPITSPINPQKIVGILTLNDISRQQNAAES